MRQTLKKRLTAGFLTLCLLNSQGMIPISVYAGGGVKTEGLCEHHPEHTDECGYVKGTPCDHEHTAECYTDILTCDLIEDEDITASDSDAGHRHTQDCCELDCPHEYGEHDQTCGYAQSHPCEYVCEICKADETTTPPEEDIKDSTAEQKPDIAAGIITEFSLLDEAILNRKVESGTALEDLNLPDELEVSVRSEDETGESDTVTTAMAAVTDWESAPLYDGEAGTYVFTPVVAGKYLVEEGVKAPEITVTVIPVQTNDLTVHITDWEWIDPDEFLNEGVLSLNGVSLEHQADFDTVVSMLPTRVSAKIEGEESETLTIAGWNCPTYAKDAEGNWPVSGSYTFTADLPEGYALVEGAAVLAVQVNFPDVPVMMLVANIPYLDEDGRRQTCANATPVSSGSVALDNGWYVLNSNVTIDSLSTVSGDVHLILADGFTLAANGGIKVDKDNSLTVYAQSTGEAMGKLTATGGDLQAGIGGGNGAGGTITINGGEITATGGKCGAGIGGAYDGDGGTIIIRNGIVKATGGLTSAGIGGGGRGDAEGGGTGGNITISGGIVTAIGGPESSSFVYGSGGAGIGSGQNNSGGVVTITSGTVEAFGGMRAAGIGNGRNGGGNGGDITICGGKVTARAGGSYAAGIGGGQNSSNKSITIDGGEVTVTGGTSAAGIGGGYSGHRGNITINGGTVNATAGSMSGGAGIGDGDGGYAGTIIINGGTVNARGCNEGGAGIGGGTSQNAGRIEIHGGIVTATGGRYAAGIGGSASSKGGDIVITNGTVSATCGSYESHDDTQYTVGIGGGISGSYWDPGSVLESSFNTGDYGKAVIITTGISDTFLRNTWGGVIIQGDSGQVYGNQERNQTTVAPTEDFTIPDGKTVTIPAGMTLDINVTMTVETGGELIIDGTLDLTDGILINRGTVTGSGTITPDSKKLTAGITNISVIPTTFTGAPAQVTYTYTGNGTPTVTWYADNNGSKGSSIPAPSAAGTYHVGVSAAASGIYQAVAEKTQSFTIQGAPQDTPGATIDYEAETLTGLVDGAGYSITPSDSTPVIETAAGGTISIESGWMGKDISIVKKAVDNNHTDSAAQSLFIPNRPEAPELTYNGNAESVTVPGGYFYNRTGADYADGKWIEGNGADVPVAPGATVYIYKAAVREDSPAFKSAVQTLTAGQRDIAPELVIDYTAETLNTTDSMEYSLDGVTGWSACGADMAIPSEWTSAGKTVYIRTKAAGSTVASYNADIMIPARPKAPTGNEAYSIDTNTEKITVNSGYEVSTSSDFSEGALSDGSTVAPGVDIYARKLAVAELSFKSEIQTIAVPDRGVTPAVAIDYENETLSTTTDMQYKNGGSDWVDCEANMAAAAFGWDGTAMKSVQFSTRATADSYVSEAQTVSIPARPDAPAGSEAYSINTDTEKITVNSGYQVNTSEDFTGDTVYDGSTVAPDSVIYARKIAVPDTSFKSEVQTVTSPDRGAMLNVKIDYMAETLSTTAKMQYKARESEWIDCEPDMAVTDFGWDGMAEKIVHLRMKATEDHYASESQSLLIPARPAVPNDIQGINETVAGRNNGQITGVSDQMEYSANGGMNWMDCPDRVLQDLTPGVYLVRLKAVTKNESEAFTGHIATVTIAIGAEPTYTLNVTAPVFADVAYGYKQPDAQAVNITGSGNSSATITSVTVSPETAFAISGSGDTVTAGGYLQTWMLQPKSGLDKGVYTAVIIVSYNSGATAAANVSFTVNSAAQAAPAAPELERKTTSSVILKEISENANGASVQYSKDGGVTWQDNREFIGLSSGTAYSFTARYAGNGNYEASPASDSLNVKTSTPSSRDGGSSGSSGDAAVTISNQSVTDAIDAAEKLAGKNGMSVTININLEQTANSLIVTIPQAALDKLIAAEVDEFKISSSLLSMGFNLEALKEIRKSAADDLIITAKTLNVKTLSSAAQAAIGSRPVFDLSMQSGGKAITSFGQGAASVRIPYTLEANESAGNVLAVYVDGQGAVNAIISSSYDQNRRTVMFCTDHFSVFGVGYKQDAPKLNDITAHWAENDIKFVVARGLFSDTGNNQFSPDTAITRGMFVTALGRLAGVDTSSYKTSKFTDVPETAYYAPYANWAVSVGITSGTTVTTFGPDESVSRQEMAVFMNNYARAVGYIVPEVRADAAFADNGSIAGWAANSVKHMQMAGVINGKDGNRFDPTGITTRAEVCAVLRRYVELVIDPTTANGWVKNDSGHWIFYKDGVMVVNTRVDGHEIGPDGVRKEI